MYGTVLDFLAVERQKYLLEEARRRHRFVTAWRDDRPRRRTAPTAALWRAVMALIRST